MLKALLKVNFAAFFSWMTKNASSDSSKKTGRFKLIAYAVLLVYAFGCMAWIFGMMFDLLAEPLYNAGVGWLFFVYLCIMSFALMFILSAFAAKNRLYESKDNDLLLSMPIPPSYILASRMSMLFVINVLTGLLVAAPALYVWFRVVPFSAGKLICALLVFLALALFALAISSLFGWLLSKASAGMRKKALFETVLSLGFLALYFYGYSKINQIIEGLLANTESIADTMSGIAPLYWLGAGAAGDVKCLLLALCLLVVPFVIACAVLSRTFIKTATARRGTVKVKYEAKEQKASPVKRALLKREAGRFFSSSVCIVNNGLGAVFLLVAAAALRIYGGELRALLAQLPGLEDYALGIMVLAATLMAGMVTPTSSLVSLEGKSLWIVQSMPVSPAQVLCAKLRLSLLLYLPSTVLCMLAVVYTLKPASSLAVCALLLPPTAVVVMAELGLIVNVNHPSLNWTTEAQAVKSGISVLISMLYDMGIIAVMGVGGYLMLKNGVSLETVLMILLVVLLVAARMLYGQIVTRSAEKFAHL